MKLETIATTVLDKIEKSCRCGFIRDRITDEIFRCFPASPQSMTYRVIIHGTAGATSTQLISHIEQWTAEGATVIINQILLSVDTSCSVATSSIRTNEECPKVLSTASGADFAPATLISSESVLTKLTNGDTGIEVPAIIGGSIVAMIIVVIAIASAVMAITILILKNHHTDKNSQQPR